MLSKAQYPIAFGENMEYVYFPKRYYKFIYIYPSLYVGCFSSKPQAMKMEKKRFVSLNLIITLQEIITFMS